MPKPLSSLAPFEKSSNVSISFYEFDNRKLVTVYYIKHSISKRFILLLRLVSGPKSDYCLINIFPICFSFSLDQKRNEDRVPSQSSVQTASSPLYEKTTEVTQSFESPTFEFVNWQISQRVPFVVYADLGAIDVLSESLVRVGSNTKEVERQYACSFRTILVREGKWFFSATTFAGLP